MSDNAGARPRRAGSFKRVADFLGTHGLADRIVQFDDRSTKTSQLAADAVGCELGQIVKSLVFMADDTPVLALVAGDRRGDAKAIADLAGAKKVRFADAEAVRDATGYAIGGVSPFDLPDGLTVLVDDSLARFETVYTAAGTPQSMVRMDRITLLRLVGGDVARISR